MMTHPSPWIIDPISYTGLAYYDISLAKGLARNGVAAVLIGADDFLLSRHRRHGVPILPLFRGTSTGSRARRGANYVRSLIRLLMAAAHERPALAHWQYFQLLPADLAAITLMKRLRIPMIYTAHEIMPWRNQGRVGRIFLRAIYRSMDRIIVHNRSDRLRVAEQFGVDRHRVRVITHGDFALFAHPDLDQDVARCRLGLPQDAAVALFFGTLRPSKGLDVLLAAWPLVVEHLPAAHLVVAGQPDRDLSRQTLVALQRMGGDPRTRGSVTLRLQKIADADINAYYRAADVVVLPYHAITTSGVLRYAYSSARPVVATVVGEHAIWVRHGVTGELVAPGDPTALARSLLALLSDRNRCAALGLEALRFARAHFNWERIGSDTAALYAEVGRGTRRGFDSEEAPAI